MNDDILKIAKEVFETEGQAVLRLSEQLGLDFVQAVETLLACKGRVVVSGIGKSGIIARKMVATFSSTGTPSMFLHPAEALHGDLGMIKPEDVLIGLSKSGETEELLRLVPHIRNAGVPFISLLGNPASTLGKHADYVLDVSIDKEACPLQLAPTASTTATLAMGDALAMSLMQLRNFQPENFAHFHPGGSLGRRLLTTVGQIMRTHELPIIPLDTDVQTVIHTISAGRLGLAIILEKGELLGIITDGDVRRAMEKLQEDFFKLKAGDLMVPHPIYISPLAKAVEAENLMREKKITSLLVVEHNNLKGVIQIYDLGL